MHVDRLRRRFVYHSPHYPGFTSWCGLWRMPDDGVMCSFTQASGPFRGRPRAPEAVRRYLDWPPQDGSGRRREEYDMTGLDLENVHIASSDRGQTWRLVGTDSFRSCMNGTTGEAEVGLEDGTLLRGVWGPYLPYDEVPRTGFMQRSVDPGRTWQGPEVVHSDPGYLFWPKRIRRLRDGRVVTGGGLVRRDPEHDHRAGWFRDATIALFVADDGGRNWEGPIEMVAPQQRGQLPLTEEFDWAELDGGELLVVIRGLSGSRRLQTVLPRAGDRWRPGTVVESTLPHSGHPELLATASGAVLHVATTGLSCTRDRGATWLDLTLDDGLERLPGSPYYPRSVQLADGEILIVGHVGADDGYGLTDQSVVSLRFYLES